MLREKFLNFFYLPCAWRQRDTVMLIPRWLYKYMNDCKSLKVTGYDSFLNMTVDFMTVFDLRLKGAVL